MRFPIVVLLGMVTVSFTSIADAIDPVQAREEKLNRFVVEGPLFLFGKTLSELRRLASLQSETVEIQANRFIPSQTVEYRTLTYDGLVVHGNTSGQNRLSPILVIVTSPYWRVKNGLSVGTPITRVTKVLGEPTSIENQVFQYCGHTDCASFTVKDGKIAKIRFDYYAD